MTDTPRTSLPWRPVVLDVWPAVLAVLLCWPLLAGAGHPLARDLVFVPHQPWTDASIGLGESAPRAVPLDAVVSLLTAVVDGGVLARIVLPLGLALAGWGTHRLVRGLGTVGRLVAGGAAVWNPYVVERTSLGQWALLLGYAALPWLLVAARRFREDGRARDLGGAVCWLAVASLTPTGGLLGCAAVLVAGTGRARRTGWLVAVCVLLQLPWVVPSLVGTGGGGTSDPAGVSLFAAGAEGPPGLLGTVVALVGGGGIWDAGSVPASRDLVWGPLAAVAALVALLLGRRLLRDVLELRRLAGLAAGGLAVALASSLPGGESLMETLVEHAPGAGLLRDAQKFLAPYVVLVAVAAGATAHRAVRAVAARGPEVVLGVATLAVVAPLMLLPDGAGETWPTVDPVTYPSGLDAVAERMDAEGGGDVATLPWRSYRRFAWGHGQVSSDPAVRWFDRGVVVSDDLVVGDKVVRGESARSHRIGVALAAGPVAPALAAEGVGWALVYRDDPATPDLDLAGLEEIYVDDDLLLFRVPGAEPGPAPTSLARTVVLAADSLALLVLLSGTAAVAVSARRARKPPR